MNRIFNRITPCCAQAHREQKKRVNAYNLLALIIGHRSKFYLNIGFDEQKKLHLYRYKLRWMSAVYLRDK